MAATEGTRGEAAGEDPIAFFESISSGPWAASEDPTNRLARALVQLAEMALDVDTPSTVLAPLVEQLEALGAAGRAGTDTSRTRTRYRPEDRPDGRKVRPNATGKHPLAGPVNPVAPPIVLHLDGVRAIGEVTYDLRFEGLPGLVQGGFVAAAFDLILGQAVALAGMGGMTGSLSVRYVSPTPLYQPLRYVSWLDRVDGRKTYAAGELVVADDGRVCAQAEGVFIAPRGGVPGSVD